MKNWIKVFIVLLGLFSVTLTFAKLSMSLQSMTILQVDPNTGTPNPLYFKMDLWLNEAFGVDQKYLKNTDVIEGKKAYFVVSRAYDRTVTISKRVKIHSKEMILFSGQKFHFRETPRHPSLPKAVVKYFEG